MNTRTTKVTTLKENDDDDDWVNGQGGLNGEYHSLEATQRGRNMGVGDGGGMRGVVGLGPRRLGSRCGRVGGGRWQ